jgi:glutathione S-transferase
MKLFSSDTSPYARKVRIAAIEKGLQARIELVPQSPFDSDTAALLAANPLGKIPALVLEDGSALYDSRVICEYLDGLSPAHRLIPEAGGARIDVLRRQALADGVMDAAFSLVMEQRRPEARQSSEWQARWRAGIVRGTAAMEPRETFDLGQVAAAAALGYLDFRLGALDWRAAAPAVAEWWREVQDRRSVRETAPPA